MITGLDELKSAASRGAPLSEVEKIAEGEMHWFAGHPLPSAPGTIALAQRDSLKLVFREEDLIEVHKWEERFLVRLRAGADMLVSLERVMPAGPSGCCDGGAADHKDRPAAARSRIGVHDAPRDWDVWISSFGTSCTWRIECFNVNVPLLGPLRICVPTMVWC